MPLFRAVATFESSTGINKDRCVNTFSFVSAIDDGGVWAAIKGAVDGFYTDLQAGGHAVGEWLANDLESGFVRVYRLNTPPPHNPLGGDDSIVLPARADGDDLPRETACCLSFEAMPQDGLDQTSRRGRVFLGPLNVNAVTNINGIPRPKPLMTQTFREAGKALQVEVGGIGAGVEWVVWSPKLDAYSTIGRVWTDDAFDNILKRGVDPTGKTYLTF